MEKANKPEIKCGIEIHQQLDTHKLFCECPSILRNDPAKFEIKRKLHAVAGESGKIDSAAGFEASRDREFTYQGYDTTCLVELDEEPPHLINKEALMIGLHVALHLNCEILPVAQIMRKTVVDGSNTSGFQRTVLIARNGYLDTPQGKVGIEGINIEEDAARTVNLKEDENISIGNGKVIYKLDRLGIPLVEIGTKPDIHSAEQAKETALILGDILRSCKVKRGLGTIRQDVNISITGHPRVEIKGFQDMKTFIQTFNNEIKRQETLIFIHEELKKRNAQVSTEIIDLTEILRNTECRFVKKTIDSGGKAFGFSLKGFSGLLGKEFYEGRRFGSEISDYSKVAGVSGIIHSDENLEKYQFKNEEIEKIKDKLGIKSEDSFIIIADEEKKARKAIQFAINRAKLQIEKTSPSEVRNDNPDSSTRFSRPMPGEARMYPETDHPLLYISRDIINEAKKTLPKLRSDVRFELKERGLSDEMIKLLDSESLLEFEALLKIINDPNFIAKVLLLIPKDIAMHEKIDNIEEILNYDILESVVLSVYNGKIKREDIKHVLTEIAKGKPFNEAIKIEKANIGEIEGEIAKLVESKPGLTIGGYMGIIMEKFKGKISGKEVTEILNKLLKK